VAVDVVVLLADRRKQGRQQPFGGASRQVGAAGDAGLDDPAADHFPTELVGEAVRAVVGREMAQNELRTRGRLVGNPLARIDVGEVPDEHAPNPEGIGKTQEVLARESFISLAVLIRWISTR